MSHRKDSVSHFIVQHFRKYLLKEKAIFTTEVGGGAVPQLLAPAALEVVVRREEALLSWLGGWGMSHCTVSLSWMDFFQEALHLKPGLQHLYTSPACDPVQPGRMSQRVISCRLWTWALASPGGCLAWGGGVTPGAAEHLQVPKLSLFSLSCNLLLDLKCSSSGCRERD